MRIPISPQRTFDVPEGHYTAVLAEVIHLENRKTRDGWRNQVRLLFEVIEPRFRNKVYRVGKNYTPSLEGNSELRKDLESWREHDLTDQEVANGGIDLESLIGKEASIEVRHVRNKEYDKPYVSLKSIRPAKRLRYCEVVQPICPTTAKW